MISHLFHSTPLRIVYLLLFTPLIPLSATEPTQDDSTPQEQETVDFMSLTLEQLLNTEVTSGSKRPQKKSETPAVITSYSAADMEMLNQFTLSELADQTPGYASYAIYGEKVFETRGQKAGSFNNNKHLLLIDGIPVNHAKAYKATTEEELPLFFAERVEFLRGPASSLYGVSAFYGVVSVDSKNAEELGTDMEARVSYGGGDGNTRVWMNGVRLTERGRSKIFMGFFEKDASRDFVGTVDDPNNLYWDDQKSLFLYGSHTVDEGLLEGVTAGFIYMNKNGGLGEHWMHGQWSHQINDLTWETIVPYVKYDREITASVDLKNYVKLNRSREQGWWAPFGKDSFDNYDGTGAPFLAYDQLISSFEVLSEIHWDLGEKSNLIAGVNFDSRHQKGSPASYNIAVQADPGDPFVFDAGSAEDSSDFNTLSFYAQYQKSFDFLEGSTLTLGARQDMGEADDDRYDQLSPRVAWVQKVTSAINVKALYGSALRAPGIKEVGLNQEAARSLEGQGLPSDGIGDLGAETIETLELAVELVSKNAVGTFSLFQNKTENALDGARYLNQNIFVNSAGEIKADGFDLELQLQAGPHWRFLANYSHALAEDGAGQELTDVTSGHGNFGINFKGLQGKFSATAMSRWVKDYRVSDPNQPKPDGHFLLDLNLIYHLTPNTRISLSGKNILDEEAKYPKTGLPDVPLARQNISLSLTSSF